VGEPPWKQTLEEKRRNWEEISKTLKDDERKMYEAILEAGGMISQSELPEKTGAIKDECKQGPRPPREQWISREKEKGDGERNSPEMIVPCLRLWSSEALEVPRSYP